MNVLLGATMIVVFYAFLVALVCGIIVAGSHWREP